jgi:hypothetical protein
MHVSSSTLTRSAGTQRSRIASRVIGILLVTSALVVLFAMMPPLRRLALDYEKRLGKLCMSDDNLFAKRTGAGLGFKTLPPVVQAMSAVLKREKIDTYWVSPDLQSNWMTWQRIVEGNWPHVPRSDAHAIFRPMGKTRDPACRVVTMADVGYELAVCP